MTTSSQELLQRALRSEGPVHARVENQVAFVELHRPDQRNAINSEMVASLPAVMTRLGTAAQVRAVVLTGAGRAFCAGLDLDELGSTGDNLRLPTDPEFPYPWGPLPVPVIGAVNGPAVTGGFELAMACDIVLVARSARFADTHARVGQVPGAGLSVRLGRAVGPHRAAYLHLTGNFIDAETAVDWGLAMTVVDDDQLHGASLAIAHAIVSSDAAAVAGVLGLLRLTAGEPVTKGLALELAYARDWQGTHDDPGTVASRRAAILERAGEQLASLQDQAT